jgi:hypothetical protein
VFNFKKAIMNLALEQEATILTPLLEDCYAKFHRGEILHVDFVGIFILYFIGTRRKDGWSNGILTTSISESILPKSKGSDACIQSDFLSSHPTLVGILNATYLANKFNNSGQPFENITIYDIFNRCRLKGLKNNKNDLINRSLILWYHNLRPYVLLFHIPTPMEVLQYQSQGQRIITLFYSKKDLSMTHNAKLYYMKGMPDHSKDAFEFLLHDIQHMEHFMTDDCYHEQVGFFKALYNANDNIVNKSTNRSLKNFFLRDCGYDILLWHELEYVISDM